MTEKIEGAEGGGSAPTAPACSVCGEPETAHDDITHYMCAIGRLAREKRELLLTLAAARNMLEDLIAHHSRMAANWVSGGRCSCNIIERAEALRGYIVTTLDSEQPRAAAPDLSSATPTKAR